MSDPSGVPGQLGLFDPGSVVNRHAFQIDQMQGRQGTVKLIKIIAVHLPSGNGALAQAGTIDVQPITSMTDVQGNSQDHGTVYGLIYNRAQGGKNAIIHDPAVGDIGLALIADRDISANKQKRGPAPPGSRRRFDLADGIYIGGVLNDTPDQFVRFFDNGVEIGDKNGQRITMQPGFIHVQTAELRVSGKVIAGYGSGDQISLQSHTHPTTPDGSESPPNPGT